MSISKSTPNSRRGAPTSFARSRTTSRAGPGSGPTTQGMPGFTIPDFSNAMDSIRSPRMSVCSSSIVEMQATSGWTMLVESRRPPRPTSRRTRSTDARLKVLGDHQAVNASLAIAAVRCLGGYSDDSLERAVREGLPRVELPGRVEIIAREPWVLVDEAHTVASTEALVKLLPAFEASECHLVLSISRDKKLGAILRSLLPSFDRVIVTRSEKHRSMDPVKLAAEIRQRGHVDVEVCPDPRRAVQQARKGVGRRGLLCAAGSIYLAGIAREEFRRHAQ